ncbi:hypothetical protein [Pleomorphomonas sp. PLEO]|uniref:hypothetical protein n=1 Tax=Pleomorphomonas sp. PLEO TaxID=3239306 RepID=UPI00351F71E9
MREPKILRDLAWQLSKVAQETKPCHWISTPDGDQGDDWCPDCGNYKVRNLRRHDRRRRREYILDGGWCTDHDSMPFCAGCGSILSGSLTSYGSAEELAYYLENGLSETPRVDAIYLAEIMEALVYIEIADCDLSRITEMARQTIAAAGGANG